MQAECPPETLRELEARLADREVAGGPSCRL